MRWLVRLLVLVALIVLVVAGVGAWFGVVQVPVLSAVFGMDRPADIGADAPDRAAYDAFVDAHGLTHTSPDANYSLASKHTFGGSYSLDETISEAIINATRTMRGNASSFHDARLAFHDGSAEAAAFVDLGPYGYPLAGPVRTSFRVEVTGPKAVRVTIDKLDFGRIGVPGDILARAQDGVNSYLATRLPEVDGLNIEELAFVEGGVRFRGTLPSSFGASAPKPGDLP